MYVWQFLCYCCVLCYRATSDPPTQSSQDKRGKSRSSGCLWSADLHLHLRLSLSPPPVTGCHRQTSEVLSDLSPPPQSSLHPPSSLNLLPLTAGPPPRRPSLPLGRLMPSHADASVIYVGHPSLSGEAWRRSFVTFNDAAWPCLRRRKTPNIYSLWSGAWEDFSSRLQSCSSFTSRRWSQRRKETLC